jgi:REP element-mobilizing transposase RayT
MSAGDEWSGDDPDLLGLKGARIYHAAPRNAFSPDQYYHFYNRGNNRQAVFFERDNYLYFLRNIKKYLRGHVEVLAYCLMPTHYHILVRVKQQPPEQQTSQQTSEVLKTSEVLNAKSLSSEVSNAMMKLVVSYTKAINKRFSRVGSLFQGQFHGKPIETYSHLLNLCMYIHANPVKDGLVFLPEEWEFSNYPEWMNLRAGNLVNREFIAENFGMPEEYKTLVMQYIKTRSLPDEVIEYIQELES